MDEYRGLPCEALVKRGFMAPVFCLNFQPLHDSGEVSARCWELLLQEVGYLEVTTSPLFDYWWAPCVAITSRSFASFDRAPLVSKSLEIVSYGGKGRGYRATQSIQPKGEVLLREQPLIIPNLESERDRYRAIGAICCAGLARNSEEAHEYVMENGFRVGSQVHLFRQRSLFNHSCFPNASVSLDDPTQVIAIRPIQAGEEVTISYIAGVLSSVRTCLLFCLLNCVECACASCLGLSVSVADVWERKPWSWKAS